MSITYLDFNNAPSQSVDDEALSANTVRQALLSQLENVLTYLLPHGQKHNNTYVIGDLNDNPGESLKIALTGDKAGLWHDFATGEGGDILSLWAARHGLKIKNQFTHVLRSASDWLGLSASNTTHTTLNRCHYDELGTPTNKWDYHNNQGQLIACLYRYETKDGKQYRPWDVVNRKHCAPNPRPLYNQPGIKNADHVILVEGEKAADSLIEQGIAATTAMLGAKAPVTKTDWSPLACKHVVIWPDNDKTGKDYAKVVSEHLAKETLLLSLRILTIPNDKPEKWDAADAMNEGGDVEKFIAQTPKQLCTIKPLIPTYSAAELLSDTSPMPVDLIAPRVLTPSGLMVLGGAPKVGKSSVLLTLLVHMAAGIPFLGLTPKRPLRIFYLQTEVGYHYLRERLQQLQIDSSLLPLVHKNLNITSQSNQLLDKEGVDMVSHSIQTHFPDEPADIIAVDPLRNVFDGGHDDASENDNASMLFFLSKRLEALRNTVNPDAGLILAHHTRKLRKRELTEDPFQALSGASSLRGYYTTGAVLFKEDEQLSPRKLLFELRNGKEIKPKYIDRNNGQWHQIDNDSKRLVKDKYACKLAAESKRKQNVILQFIREEAKLGNAYTMNQFCQAFANKSGLGGIDTVRNHLNILATNRKVKFFKDGHLYGLKDPLHSKFGFLCVEGMQMPNGKTHVNPDAGEATMVLQPVFPTHYKCKKAGDVLPVNNQFTWDVNTKEVAQ